MFEEIKKLKDLIVLWLLVFVILAAFFFFFSTAPVDINGVSVPLPAPSDNSFSVQFFKMMQEDLLPGQVTLVSLSPLSAFNAQGTIAFLLSFIFTFPFFLYRLVKYLAPALYRRERRALTAAFVPVMVLFSSGVLFAYLFVIPPTFKALYLYTDTFGAKPLFSVDAFISSVMMFMLVVGVLFLMPIVMVLLSFLKIIPAAFWWRSWRYALFTFVVFSAIITPDGSGVSMMILALPLGILYAAGAGVASMRRVEQTG